MGFAVSVTKAPAHVVPSLFVVPEVSATLTDAEGSGLTVIATDEDAEQPVAAIVGVTVYVVVDEGEAEGFETVELLKAVVGDQVYV